MHLLKGMREGLLDKQTNVFLFIALPTFIFIFRPINSDIFI